MDARMLVDFRGEKPRDKLECDERRSKEFLVDSLYVLKQQKKLIHPHGPRIGKTFS
jgi:hypothetical protein